MKRLLSLLGLLIVALSTFAQTFTMVDLTYYVTSTTNKTVQVSNGKNATGDVIVPGTVTYNDVEYSVTAIGYMAFEQNANITSVSMPSVTSIDKFAFSGCTSLISVSIPAATSIDNNAFYNCTSLTYANLPAATSIGISAFSGCTSLTYANLPAAISIGLQAFHNCSNISSLRIGSVEQWCNVTFENGTSSPLIPASHPVELYIGDSDTPATSIEVSSTVTEIPGFAFCNTTITSVSASAATSIGSSTFSGCTSLTYANLPTATSIGEWAFNNCTSLTYASLPAATSIGSHAFRNCTSLTSVNLTAATSIDQAAFYECYNINSVRIGSVEQWCSMSVSNHGDFGSHPLAHASESVDLYVGDSETPATSIEVPSTVTKIPDHAFSHTTITSASLLSVTSIGNRAFSNCSSLTSLTLPAGLNEIGEMAFGGCTELTSATNLALIPQEISKNTFNTYGTLHVLPGCKAAYEAADYWNNFTIVEDAETESIENGDTDSGNNEQDNIIFFNDARQWASKQITMPLMMNNTAEITAMQFDLVLPEGITLDKNAKGKYALTFNAEAERTDASMHTLSSNLLSDGSIRVLCYSNDKDAISGNTGAVIDFPLTIATDMVPDRYPIILKNVILTATDKSEYKIPEVVCMITVPDYEMGDVNGDKEVTVTDIVYVSDYILGNSDPAFNPLAADMNEDGEINVTDIVYIADKILSGEEGANAKSMAKGHAAGSAMMKIDSFSMAAGNTKTVTLDMQNEGKEIVAFQCNIILPEGMSINSGIAFNEAANRTDAYTHSLATAQNAEDVKVLCYSVTNDAIAGTSGAVLNLPVFADAAMADGQYEITVSDIVMTCKDKTQLKPADVTATVSVGGTTAINMQGVTPDASAEYYNVGGQQLGNARKGISIIRTDAGVGKVLR